MDLKLSATVFSTVFVAELGDRGLHGSSPRTTAVTKLTVKVVPGSSRACIAGWLGDTLRIRVTAVAERGKANAAVEATLAEALGIPQASARVVRGMTSQRKVVEVVGLSESEVHRRLAKGAS
jgi:hypothetical protein